MGHAIRRLFHAKATLLVFILSIFQLLNLSILLTSCESFNCPLNNTVASVYNFYAANRNTKGELITGTSVSVTDTITISAIDLDSVIANRLNNASTVSLPMSFYNATDSLCWLFTDSEGRTATDTIIIHKSNLHHFDDPSCPIQVWHHIDSIYFSRNIIDTIIVANADVNYDGLENFQIYFRTADTNDENDENEE